MKLDKLLSGRFLLTIIVAGVFACLSMTDRLPADKVSEIILLVVYAYFTKARANGGGK
jgi:hypothetical protein